MNDYGLGIKAREQIVLAAKEVSKINADSRVKPSREIGLLKAGLRTLRSTYKTLVFSKEAITPGFEWLYDNYYIFEREGRLVIKELSHSKSLPSYRGVPLVMLHAKMLCETADGEVTQGAIELYLDTVQSQRELESEELIAFELMLRTAVIDIDAGVCRQSVSDDERRRAFSDSVKTLSFLNTFDFSEIIEKESRIENILSNDPSEVYSKMDERSRAVYRSRISKIAKIRGISESDAANEAVELAKHGETPRERHVGEYIIDTQLGAEQSNMRGQVYLTLLWLMPLIVSVIIAVILKRFWLPVILYFPLWEILRPVTEFFVMRGVEPTFIPRMDIRGKIPDGAETLVVLSALLTSPSKVGGFAKKLEQFYYSNGGDNIMFAVLADLKEARIPEKPEDKALKEAASKEISALNRKYGDHFCLILRGRRYSHTQDCFTGWERKRGAIVELVRMIKGKKTSVCLFEGDLTKLRKTKYIIALDSDTVLVMDSAAEMVSAAMHPLNAPQIEDGKVTRGFGILAPRISVDIESAAKTPFSRIMAGAGGVTAYDVTAGDVYQDIFGISIFAGKGLLNVDAFYEVLDNAFPENRVLSHDILEGCFLRTGYLSDVELTDGFPASPSPWFDRLHRWIRGDWQNIGYIFKNKTNGRFDSLCRFRLFDNLRRSITPVFAFACLITSAFLPLGASITLIAAAVLSLAGSGLLTAVLAVIRGGPSMLSRKYHCRVLPQAEDALAQSALSYLFLPDHARIAFDAVIRAILRLLSGKNLLEWVTAAEAEQSEKAKNNRFSASIKKFGFSFIVGLLLTFFAPSVAAKIAGAFFLITPFVSWYSGVPTPALRDDFTDEDADRLHSYTAAMWRFYEEFATAEENYLPPDNYQEAPVSVVAHRTSPTNIGLLLLSVLAARDMNLIDTDTLFSRVESTLSTIEKLQKWKGHLLNWYDTKTLQPLIPRYISTVDSGNFVCCLVALREGLYEYQNEYGALGGLDLRLKKLIDDTDLGTLYNAKRKLFHLGFDLERCELTPIYYDFLMSEARMTSYYAVAKRIAPKRHWGALGRTLTRQNGYTGPVSWTGTMFEYLMPHLLLPVYEDSMAAEALRFVIYCQKRRVKDRGVPWGISESGFYSFDANLNYQYEANGVQKLALKRGMNDSLVISPYSTFLALPFDRNAGMKNLRRLEKLGMYGHCGFFEAADFTPSRTGGEMAIVKSFMAHHIGMSIIAADNAINDGIMQERFMRNQEMRAAKDLLLEKIPADAVVFSDVLRRDTMTKPNRFTAPKEDFSDVSPLTPRVNAISNGEYTMVLTDCGASYASFHSVDVTRRCRDLLRAPAGIFALASFDGEVLSATAAPEYRDKMGVKRRVGFNDSGAVYYVRSKTCGLSMTACLSSQTPCEVRSVEVENYSSHRLSCKLLFYFEPCLSRYEDFNAHPAFSRLFLSVDYRSDIKTLIFRRRVRSKEAPCCIAVGFEELDADFEFEGDRAAILTRPYGAASLGDALEKEFSNHTGALTDAALAIRLKTELAPHSRKQLTLLVAAATTPEEAAARLVTERRRGFHAILKNAASRNPNMVETRLSSIILPQILFPVCDTVSAKEDERDDTIKRAVAENRLSQSGLWQLGVSGDFAIVLFEYNSLADLEHLDPYIRAHRLLRLKSINFDLVIVYREGGDYARTEFDTLKSCARACCCEYLLGERAGIHFVNLAMFPDDVGKLLFSSACHIAVDNPKQVFMPYRAAKIKAVYPIWEGGEKIPTYGGGFTEKGFTVSHIAEAPVAPWCHIIATPTFGTLVSDRALGFTWAINARENKLTPWSNDTAADNRGEMLIVKVGMKYYDVCENARVDFSPGEALFESEQDDYRFRLSVKIAGEFMAKELDLEIESTRKSDALVEAAYYTEPILGVSAETSRHIAIKEKQGTAFIRNPWAQIKGCSFVTAFDEKALIIKNRGDFLSGAWHSKSALNTPDPCVAVIVKRRLPPRRTEEIKFILGFAGDEAAAKKSLELLQKKDRAAEVITPSVKISTPDQRLDEMINVWLPNQFIGSRINGRTGFYQCGGAYGFRDQLQDSCAALFVDERITKTHIYRCAAHQFKEGDVMHWWHQLPLRDGGSKGVRTRCSDDLLWLVYTVCEYLEKTGDYSLFDHEVYYLDGEELKDDEDDRYFVPVRSVEKENVYGHCIRAIKRSITAGSHGIPLFGNGDWNDGMNLVGKDGKGESVWLAMFEILCFERFINVARRMKDDETANLCRNEAERLKKAVDDNCWNGKWYARGFYDDGTPLGVKESDECRIDILPQSFATIADLPDIRRRREALDSMTEMLVDERLRIVRLFDPPFDKSAKNPGYIRSYAPGIRENGGQYTHAAIWAALALLLDGRCDEGYKILQWISPAQRTEDAESAKTYRLEPFSIAADISTNPAVSGRGGWSLYTGAAGWYYRTVIDALLGIKITAEKIMLRPQLPSGWRGFEAEINKAGAVTTINVRKGDEERLTVDGKEASFIPVDGKPHTAKMILK